MAPIGTSRAPLASRQPSWIATVASQLTPRWSSVMSSRRTRVAQAFWQASSIVCAGALTLRGDDALQAVGVAGVEGGDLLAPGRWSTSRRRLSFGVAGGRGAGSRGVCCVAPSPGR